LSPSPVDAKPLEVVLVDLSASSRGQKDGFCVKEMEFSFARSYVTTPFAFPLRQRQEQGDNSRNGISRGAQTLVVKGIEDHPSCMVGRVARPLHRLLTIVPGMSSKVPLGNLPVGSAVERDAHMFQFVDHPGRLLTMIFDGVLISKVITSLDRVVKMPLPVVLSSLPRVAVIPPWAAPE